MSDEKSNLEQAYEKDGALVSGGVKTFQDGYSMGQDLAKGDMKSVAGDVKSTASDATSFAYEAVSAATDPLNYLISKGLGFLEDWLTPLKDAIEMVTGDSEELKKSAKQFDQAAADLNKLAVNVVKSASDGGAGWSGNAAPGAGKKFGETKDGLEAASDGAGHIATLLKISSMLMKAAYDIINGILADLIEWLVITWLAALAAEIPTFGASTAAAGASTGVEVGIESSKAAGEVSKVSKILRKIMEIIQKVLKFLKKCKFTKDTKFLKEAKDVNPSGSVLKNFKNLAKDGEHGLGKAFEDSASKQVRSEFGLPDKGDTNPLKWEKALSSDIPTKAGDLSDGAGTAYDYSSDPGAQSSYGQENVPATDRYTTANYGFPSQDRDLEGPGVDEAKA